MTTETTIRPATHILKDTIRHSGRVVYEAAVCQSCATAYGTDEHDGLYKVTVVPYTGVPMTCQRCEASAE